MDTSGSPVPNANIKVTNTTTGQITETKANNNGQYEVSVFPLGNYDVKASAQGNETRMTTTGGHCGNQC